MTGIESQLDTFLQANLDHYIQETAELCAQPSISARKEGVLECAELVIQILKRHDLQVQKFETAGSPILVGHASGESDRTCFFTTTMMFNPLSLLSCGRLHLFSQLCGRERYTLVEPKMIKANS